jgi:hypothetical protein
MMVQKPDNAPIASAQPSELNVGKENPNSVWQWIRYPIGAALIAVWFYAKIQPPSISYSNAAQEGGSSIASILVFWLLFYIFIARKNGPLLNLCGPFFGFLMAYLVHVFKA